MLWINQCVAELRNQTVTIHIRTIKVQCFLSLKMSHYSFTLAKVFAFRTVGLLIKQ